MELLYCLTKLTEDDEEQSLHESKDWEKVVDREGGLLHMNHNFFMVVMSIEIQLLKQLQNVEKILKYYFLYFCGQR